MPSSAQANYTGKNNLPEFGREMMQFLSSKLPYSSHNVVDKIKQLNPKYEMFYDQGTKRMEALTRQSVGSSISYADSVYANVIQNKDYHEYMYANIQPDKGRRLMDYRVMAAYSEVADALDEICDEFINKDDNGDIVKLIIKNEGLSETEKKNILDEFRKYIDLFDLEHKGWEYLRDLLVNAELYFEHIIHKQYPKEGILGVMAIPPDLIDPIYSNVQNMVIKGYLLRKAIYDSKNPTKVLKTEMIPMDGNQVTYINSGIWNENKTLRLPFIENARRAYRQLSLIEDAVVIYRLVRAPERLVFNVDTGNLPAPKAEAYLRKLMTNYWSKRTYDSDQGATVQKMSPQSMLDCFWFAKRTGSEGTSVQSLPGGANLGELTDLYFFTKKLYKALKVPTTRLDPEDAFRDGADILREELKFARFIIRLQQRFAEGLKNGFVTHLRLKGTWEKLQLKEFEVDLVFNVPTNFYELRENQKFQLKADNYSTITSNGFVSNLYAQKRYLGWTDTDVMANREFLRKDKELMWELTQIENSGPNWKDSGAETVASNGAEMGGGGSAAPTNPNMPPGFGPGPQGAEAGEQPENGAEPQAGNAEPNGQPNNAAEMGGPAGQ